MKNHLKQLVQHSLQALIRNEAVDKLGEIDIQIERARDEKHGDFATNIALMLAKRAQKNPRELAELILANLPASDYVHKTEIAGPGFINFFLAPSARYAVVVNILQQGRAFGSSAKGAGQRVHVEFVSSNPTGPLHVGHGRHAAYGACIANLLSVIGYDVYREYYVNDAGRQMDIVATSVWLRYLERCGEIFSFPSNGYRGAYVTKMAEEIYQAEQGKFRHSANDVFADVIEDACYNERDECISGDKEAHIDGVVANAKQLLADHYASIFNRALETILKDIKNDLHEFGVDYDHWFSEHSLAEAGSVEHCLEVLLEKGYLFEKEGATWFQSSAFGDEKDRVVRRANGSYTYFATDIAYHLTKLERGFDQVIDVLGADHHGYVPRVRAAMQALTGGSEKFIVAPLVQFVALYRGEEKVKMSTRVGSFVTLRELREEVGNDAARFFYVMRKVEQALDFDLELAKSQSQDNPIYYIQYAHARICSVMRQADEREKSQDKALGLEHLDALIEEEEMQLAKALDSYSELIESAALNYAPYMLANYLRELAQLLHQYYNQHQFIVDDKNLCQARFCLIQAVKQVLANGLHLLGVTPVEKM